MNYCLSSQVSPEYIKKAQEIRLKDLNKLLDFYELNKNLTFIYVSPDKENINWDQIEKYNTMTQNKLIIETKDFQIMDVCKSLNIKFFYSIPVNTLYDLKALVDYGCSDVRIDAPLTHMLDKVDEYDITIRMCPNVAYYAYIPREDGVIGSWVRPEDVDYYEGYVQVFEFEDCDKKKEEALYRIYAEQRSWPNDINKLITNLNYSGAGKLIFPDFGKFRRFCGQKCLKGVPCSLCYRMMGLSRDTQKIRDFISKNSGEI